jgi:putative transposase
MIHTHSIPVGSSIPRWLADALNRESGQVYSLTMVEHYRVYRRTGHWLSTYSGQRLNDYYLRAHFSTAPDFMGPLLPPLLHAFSRDAAQQGFYKACKTARSCQKAGLDTKYPHKRKWYRPTVWYSSGIRVRADCILLSLSGECKLSPIRVPRPEWLAATDKLMEVRLVYDRLTCGYEWHLVVEDGTLSAPSPGTAVLAADLGQIHPAALTDGVRGVVISCRALRSGVQYRNKRVAELQEKQSHHQKGSRRYRRVQRRKTHFLAKQKRRERDILHKCSRAIVDTAVEMGAGTIALGDVRDIADKPERGRVQNQRLAGWSHGKMRAYIEYKAGEGGIKVELVEEHYTSQTCPQCGHLYKPKGRIYKCPACGFRGHRDIVGAANILSRYREGAVGKVSCEGITPKYRHPYLTGKRSPLDTRQVARAMCAREAAPLQW